MSNKNKWKSAVLVAGCAISLASVGSSAHAAILANSVTGFSGTQGGNGWSYLEQRGVASPTLMDSYPTNPWGIPSPSWNNSAYNGTYSYTTIWSSGAHPGGNGAGSPGTASAIRRWTNASYTGLVDITGTAQLEDPSTSHGNGTSMGIYLNGVLLPGGTGSTINMPSTGTATPMAFSFTNVAIAPTDIIDFILYGGQNLTFGTNIQSDATDLSAVITSVPEPASLGLLASGAVLVLARRKRA